MAQEIAKKLVSSSAKNILSENLAQAKTDQDIQTIKVEHTITEPLIIDFRDSPQTVNLLPGVFHLQKGFNAYKGVPFFEGAQSDKDIFTFTFDDQKGTSGDTSYLVPDQMDIPPLSYMCIYSDRASEIVTGNSSEFMQAYSSSISKESEYSAEAGGYGVSASVAVSMSSANSSARQSSSAARSEGKTSQMSTSAIATLYTFALKAGTEQTFLSEDFKSDLASVKDEETAF